MWQEAHAPASCEAHSCLCHDSGTRPFTGWQPRGCLCRVNTCMSVLICMYELQYTCVQVCACVCFECRSVRACVCAWCNTCPYIQCICNGCVQVAACQACVWADTSLGPSTYMCIRGEGSRGDAPRIFLCAGHRSGLDLRLSPARSLLLPSVSGDRRDARTPPRVSLSKVQGGFRLPSSGGFQRQPQSTSPRGGRRWMLMMAAGSGWTGLLKERRTEEWVVTIDLVGGLTLRAVRP